MNPPADLAGSRARVAGRAVPLPGDDVDTDRILPARFTRLLRFRELGTHVFADDRAESARRGEPHPLDDPRFRGASIALVGRNFGCGSSREHAVHALAGWQGGIRALVGESFASIFFANCVANGIPAVAVDPAVHRLLRERVGMRPELGLHLDLERCVLELEEQVHAIRIPESARARLLDGTWDSAAWLCSAGSELAATAARLPYWNGWRSRAGPA